MSPSRIIQLVALAVMILALIGAGSLLPGIVQRSDDRALRYTNVSVEGAPPIVVVGTAIGALRGLIVDYLWIKANAMKEKGLYYEAMADADLITKLQPRFAAVWAFHGHNLAYNISVATNTKQERWEWVNAGIRLVRNQGLRYNPNDMLLHRELSFWFGHKIEGVSDDAHLYYKREFCNEWHHLLGQPPEEAAAHLAWIKAIADAPETLGAAEQRTPGVAALVERLTAAYEQRKDQIRFTLNKDFLTHYVRWQAVKQQSGAAKALGIDREAALDPFFVAMDSLATDPNLSQVWDTLLAHVRKRVLVDEYNMDPQLMYRYELELGAPIEWRHGQAHALYFARRGAEFGQGRLSNEDLYIGLNNDSQQIQAMQDLARFGRISFDPFSNELPGRFPDPRWIDVIDRQFEYFYKKHDDLRGAGGERFIVFLQNFMGSAICYWYRAGEIGRAQALLNRLHGLFGSGPTATTKYIQPLDTFVWAETEDQYQAQPHLAPRDIAASLNYGLKLGIVRNQPEVLVNSLKFTHQVTDWFKGNHWNEYTDRYGEARIADIIGSVEDSAEIAYLQTMLDPTLTLDERSVLWLQTDRVEAEVIRDDPKLLGRTAPAFRALVYDRMVPMLQMQYQGSEVSANRTFEELFPPPPNLEQQRILLEQRKKDREKKMQEIRERDPFQRR
ncbi:MAG: hypothetical protein L0Y44_04665 [Phycisphaerales bacterium]|nr:hypothetical protein [Phycisphaerales bacterium]